VVFANAVNVRDDDVPGMTVISAGFELNGGVPPFGSCVSRVRSSDMVVAVSSPRFRGSRGQKPNRLRLDLPILPVEAVRSLVYVMRDPDVAKRNVAAARGASAPACVARRKVTEASGRLVGGEPYKGRITASTLRFPLSGVTGYGLRVRGTLAAALFHRKTRPTYYEDTFGFAIGPAEIILHADAATRPFPSAVEQRLLSMLYDRAKAHALS
jgi:hypothetical protein